MFNKECTHNWTIKKISNVLQQDEMGYPLRLCIAECTICGKIKQVWVDVSENCLKELQTGESVLLEWKDNV